MSSDYEQLRRRIDAARLYIETLRRMHPEPAVLESLAKQERELNEIEAQLPDVRPRRPRHRRGDMLPA